MRTQLNGAWRRPTSWTAPSVFTSGGNRWLVRVDRCSSRHAHAIVRAGQRHDWARSDLQIRVTHLCWDKLVCVPASTDAPMGEVNPFRVLATTPSRHSMTSAKQDGFARV
jgi:hypothetical protein